MENLRIALFIALALIAFQLWTAWQKEHSQQKATVTSNSLPTQSSVANVVPQLPTTAMPTDVKTQKVTENPIITVSTDVLNVKISTKGGNVVSVSLPKYPTALDTPHIPFTLLSDDPDQFYIAESVLISPVGPDTQKTQAVYTSDQTHYQLNPGENTLQVILHWKNKDNLTVNKIFTFKRGDYLIQNSYQIDNKSTQTWRGNLYTQLTRKEAASGNGGFFQIHPYIGAAISSPQSRYQEISFKKIASDPIDTTIMGGWAAMVQHYFLSAWIPNPTQTFRYYTATSGDNLYTVGMVSPGITVSPGQVTTLNSKLYTGPEIANNLKKIAPGLDLTVSYGWLWPISVAIFWLMKKIYDVVGNWGWSIIIVTIMIKLMFYHLSAKSYHSMANMRKLQPKIEAIKERYSDDKQKLSQAMMELYKTEGVNPLGGCLPVIVQIPVFFALYMVLIESVELRQAPWIGWIHDLSAKDPYYILPIIMGITMFVQQKLNPTPPDPTQAKIMMVLPVVFTFIFSQFPAGLVLYWAVNNALSILQQWYVMRQVERGETKKRVKKKVHA